MQDYKRTHWEDHIVDMDTGEVIQQGTPISARNLNNMEEGIEGNRNLALANKANITSLAVEVAILKEASLNNMTNNVFFENFNDLEGVIVTSGIYDNVGRRIYV